jgi:hypothetical protein
LTEVAFSDPLNDIGYSEGAFIDGSFSDGALNEG